LVVIEIQLLQIHELADFPWQGGESVCQKEKDPWQVRKMANFPNIRKVNEELNVSW
jgi:hypothetical protein